MDASSGLRNGAPPSIKEITDKADDFFFNVNIPFKYWIQSCKTLSQEASFALRDGDYARAYLMLYRESMLIASKLRAHPEFKTGESKKLYRSLQADLPRIIQELEYLKPEIQDQYEEWQRMQPPGKVDGDSMSRKPSTYAEHAARDISLRRNTRIIDATENLDLAVDLAQTELRKRDAAKRSARLGMSEREEQDRHLAGSWDMRRASAGRHQRMASDEDLHGRREATRRKLDSRVEDDLQAQMEAARRTLDSAGSLRPEATSSTKSRTHVPPRSGHTYHYPATSRSQPVAYVPQRPASHLPASPRPQRPPKEPASVPGQPPPQRETPEFPLGPYSSQQQLQTPPLTNRTLISDLNGEPPSRYHVPPRPRKESLDWEPRREDFLVDGQAKPSPDVLPRLPPKVKELPAALDGRKSESPVVEKVTFRPAAYLENGDPMRFVFIPSGLRGRFLDIAAPNTQRGLETCGILCGTVVNGGLFITCLLIPEQKSTPDTCETVNESAMLDYCINEDLLIIGWIHTHPTQTCFMSSRDLHTQAGYQVMMSESIAIVCAPQHEPSHGTFRLTNPPGLSHILQCSHTDTFHQHSIDNIYTGAMSPAGHVHEVSKLAFTVEDLRP